MFRFHANIISSWASSPIGSARAMPTSAFPPLRMANTVERIPAIWALGGTLPPTGMTPIYISSTLPPTKRPVWMSPSTSPMRGPAKIGRETIQ